VLAVHREEESNRFYSMLAEKIKNPEGALTFQNLAQDEIKHRQILLTWWESRFREAFPFSEDRIEAPAVSVDDQTGALDALELALEFEQQAMDLYEQLAVTAGGDKDLVKICRDLAKEEWGHFNTLSAERNAIMGAFYWYDIDHAAPLED